MQALPYVDVLGFDHLMHWVPDLAESARKYQAAGFGLKVNPERPGTGVRNGAWWKDLHYVEALTLLNAEDARANLSHGSFTGTILPAVEQTLAEGGGALNFAVRVQDVDQAVRGMRAAGVPAEQHTVKLGPIPAYTIGWPTEGPRWAPFVISYHPAVRGIQKVALNFLRRGQPKFEIRQLVVEVPSPAESGAWLRSLLGFPAAKDPTVVPLGFCELVFTPGDADRITTVELNGPGAPTVRIDGLQYRGT
jgi:catechol 2,3-dioxygenase-like lactoylglutathione lyase family enzyme